jgi:DNA-binding response OmpR family regulator
VESSHWDDASPSEIDGYSLPETEDFPDIEVCVWPVTPPVPALIELRAEPATRGIPIMAMTASVMTADRQKITDAGFDAFQSKPLKVKDFVAAVERLLDHPGK